MATERLQDVPADTPEKPVVVARGLTKRFGDFTAVDGIDFEIRPREVLGFLGPNGAGKTTTIKMITCTSPTTAGTLQIFNRSVDNWAREIKSEIGVCPQENNYDPDFTVLENLTIYGRYFGLNAAETRVRARELLEFVQLADKVNAMVDTLSGGMKRRLLLARSLLNRPRLLVLDEPTTGLDPQGRRLIWDRLRMLRMSDVTVLITTHYMDEAEQVCDRVLIIDQGKIIAEGTPAQLIGEIVGREVLEFVPADDEAAAQLTSQPSCTQFQRLGEKYEIFATDCPAVLEQVRKTVRLASYGVRRATLEDVFLRLTGRALRE